MSLKVQPSLLRLIVQAHLPLISLKTRDTVNIALVISTETGKTVLPFKSMDDCDAQAEKAKTFYFIVRKKQEILFGALYGALTKRGITLFVINPQIAEDEYFDAGEAPVPKKLMKGFVESTTSTEKVEEVMRGLGGVTLKETAELALMTMARDNSLTALGVVKSRKEYFQGQQGLTLVDTAQELYLPEVALQEWVIKQKTFFVNDTDPRLIPRGLLFGGPPGTGKTAGAKYIAEQWGVPLYRVDVASTKNKYVGESENNMLLNLNRLDREEPCIALFDEVEKLFDTGHSDSSGVSSAMLSQMLWWMAERKSRVLVIMTTNNAAKLPKELHRQGRIDQSINFLGLYPAAAADFAYQVLCTFLGLLTEKEIANLYNDEIKGEYVKKQPFGGDTADYIPQAKVTTDVFNAVKNFILNKS